tara:strand:- start:256 stop:375 length:120 start_codon:yes stop_codon:yes gene_type:complete
MKVLLERIFLGDQKLEANPLNQKESEFYKRVRDSIKKKE